MSLNIEAIHNENVKAEAPSFRAGDTVTVNVKVIEGTKERIQPFKGVVIQQKNSGISKTLTVRKMSGSVAVERIFPVSRGTYFPAPLPPHRLYRSRPSGQGPPGSHLLHAQPPR